MNIHSTALVDSSAVLGQGVEIGPYSIIEARVCIGAGTIISSAVRVEAGVTLGENNRIGPGCILGGLPQDISFDPNTDSTLHIGNDNVLREYVTVHRSKYDQGVTRIGHGNYLMGQVHVGHDCVLGDGITLIQSVGLGGHITVEDGANIGGHVAVHQFVRIGRLAIIGLNAKVARDIPPFMLADGNPATIAGVNVIGLRRAGYTQTVRSIIKSAFKQLYFADGDIRSNARLLLETTSTEEVRHLAEFILQSERGISAARRSRK